VAERGSEVEEQHSGASKIMAALHNILLECQCLWVAHLSLSPKQYFHPNSVVFSSNLKLQ